MNNKRVEIKLLVKELGINLSLELNADAVGNIVSMVMMESAKTLSTPTPSVPVMEPTPVHVPTPVIEAVAETPTPEPVVVKVPKVANKPTFTEATATPKPSRKIEIVREKPEPVFSIGDEDEHKSFEELLKMYDNPFKDIPMFQKPQMITYRCPKCCKNTVKRVTLSEGNQVNCHHCNEEITVEVVRTAQVLCDCGDRSYMRIANGLKTLSCRRCRQDLPELVRYTDNDKMLCTPNLQDGLHDMTGDHIRKSFS